MTSTQRAYSTDNPDTVAAYRKAIEECNAFAARIKADVEALGAGPSVYVRNTGFPGSKKEITGLEQKGDHIPDGWRIMKSTGHLEPRRGKPGEAARQWLADHQPVDVRHVMEKHGLPRSCWIARTELNYRIIAPQVFELEGTLWACYEAEPGTSGSFFDEQPCTWTPRKLSEFYAASEAFDRAQAAAKDGTS